MLFFTYFRFQLDDVMMTMMMVRRGLIGSNHDPPTTNFDWSKKTLILTSGSFIPNNI